ncbi:MAG: tRNA (N(6)-L-threonylcarbamoyladenosine(37)-C(2))-methylthiotransferase MtaB [Bacteroidales bacterium]|nr:tRNA (N(6)-L-threonylcarbamoyladenosine(37)-C(2))-methylthiotransferase MtaB [Bacteroidales bacterium]
MPFIYFNTLGCKLNFTETSTLKRIAEQNGYKVTSEVEKAEVIVINTCTVTQTADKKSRYAIRHLQSKNPHAKVFVTGCYVDVDPESLEKIEGVTFVFGNDEKAQFNNFLKQISKQKNIQQEEHETSFFKAYSLGDRTRSFLKVQDGCNYFCAYCKVPFARGRSRNASVDEIVQQANEIAQHGIKEVVLTGINIGDYGHTTQETFFDLIQALERQTNIERYRISSIEPNLLTHEIIDFVLSSKRFVPHFHIPLQSGSDDILKAMKRRYDTKLFIDKIQYILDKDPLTGIGIDVIVGFPGETDVHFDETLSLLRSLDFAYLHVFEYSERKGTLAATLPNKVPEIVKKNRSKLLHDLSNEKHLQFVNKNLLSIRQVLIERKNKNQQLSGFTDNYIKVSIPFHTDVINTIVPVKLLHWDDESKSVRGEIML